MTSPRQPSTRSAPTQPGASPREQRPARIVRDAAVEVFRANGLTTIFANPGSTEVPFLVGLPDDLRFVLALHEGSVVGIATGFALARQAPALVLLHTTAGLGNAAGALATARVNHAPLVAIVGQQDSRHLATEPFLAGRLDGLAGSYPVWVAHPPRPQDIPAALQRAVHEAVSGRGPALVIVPMEQWFEPAPSRIEGAPAQVLRARAADAPIVDRLQALIGAASAPAIVCGAGTGDEASWSALRALAQRLDCPVFQEAFGAQAGYPQDDVNYAGQLPADRSRLRAVLGRYDLVLVAGGSAFRQYHFEPGPFVPADTRVVVISDDPEEVHRATAQLAVLGSPAAICAELAARLPAPARRRSEPRLPVAPPPPAPAPGEPLRAGHVLAALARGLPANAIAVEESPSSRPELELRIRARAPLGFVSAAMGGLGFALPAAVGLRMGDPTRPVLAILGDGSTLYQLQALWSAAHYHVGVLFIVMANGSYAVMDRLAQRRGAQTSPWPGFGEISFVGLAQALGCAARRITTLSELERTFDQLLPGLGAAREPLLLEVAVAP